MSQYSHIIAIIATLLPIQLIGLAIYRVFLHPLAKYPGPLLAKLTGWYMFQDAVQGNSHIRLQQLHKQYGNVVRVAPSMLSFNTIEAIRDIHGDRKANVIKAGFTETHGALNGHRNLQTVTDDQVHHQKRRLISHAFSEDAIRSSEHYMLKHIRLMCARIFSISDVTEKGWSNPINATTLAQNLNLDIIGELCFGQPFNALEKGGQGFPKVLEEFSRITHIIAWAPNDANFHPFIKLYMIVASKLHLTAVQGKEGFEKAIGNMIQQRVSPDNPLMKSSAEKERKDFFYYLMQAVDPDTGDKLSLHDIMAECGLLFGAGVDTSATCLAATLFYLIHYPEKLKILQDEIMRKFSDVEEIYEGEGLRDCKYLKACLVEALRISPPVPGPLLRKACQGGLTVDGNFVPEGTLLAVPMYAVHHNELYYPDSWTFNPERWLGDGDELKVCKDAFMAFSTGPRGCIGKRVAYQEMSLALARLLFTFDVRLAVNDSTGEGDPTLAPETGRHRRKEYQLHDVFVTKRDGPLIQLKRR